MATLPISLRAAALLFLVSTAACSSKKDEPAPTSPTSISWHVDRREVVATVQSTRFTGDSLIIVASEHGNRLTLAFPLRAKEFRMEYCSTCSQKGPEAIISYTPAGGPRSFICGGELNVYRATKNRASGGFSFGTFPDDGVGRISHITVGMFNVNY